MRKSFIFIILAIATMVSCEKRSIELDSEDPQEPKEIVFNLDAKHPGTATRAVKTGWETGDVVFVFFSGASAPAYLEMKWDGTKWVKTTKNSLALSNGQTGTMTAVYLPFGSGATISNDNGSYKFSTIYYSYYLTAQLPYTVTDGEVSGLFDMRIPEGYVQFFIDETSAAATDVVELREPHMTPVKILSVGADGAVATEALAHGAPLPGYVYDKETKADGESKGYLFSGILAEEARATATDYHFTFVKGSNWRSSSFYSKEFSQKSFYRGESEGRAIKLPVVTGWDQMTGDIPVDLNVDVDGRRVYWSARNLGAAGEYASGDYFAFGETEPYYETLNPLVWKEGKSTGYSSTSYSSSSVSGRYTSNTSLLDSSDDAASVHLGGLWRMPTPSECEALTSSCTLIWVANYQYGPNDFAGPGYRVKSKVNEFTYIFLPAAGCYNGTTNDNDLSYNARYPVGVYWTSLPVNKGFAYDFFIKQSGTGTSMNGERILGGMIRPVMN
ncbi:MAG: hypothetical protein IKH00_06255 [Bacteroidales bacterium]|nr:hypothetical protein [Bacteroidales bacterium]